MPQSEGTTLFRLGECERRLNDQDNLIELLRGRLHDQAQVLQHVPDHTRRLEDLEAQNVAVLATRFDYFERKVDNMTKALLATAGSLVVAVAVFALTIASGQIG